jgi:FKBP-type peptidyl-prolyl cis-trans isomerase FklB
MKQYESNKEAGEQFLAENKKRDGVISLDNGLQYEILREGDGEKPDATDEVIVHYHGTLPNGTVFDSSVQRGESISFPLNRVIRGWTEILQLMPVGSKWKVYIPYQLGYGDRAAGPTIQPYSALIFEIDLLGIK